jgi:RNA polymerase sigma factor (sigma-70 family)
VDRSVHELRDEFYQLLDRGESTTLPLWQEIWLLFIEHPWYQAELHQAATRLLWRVCATADGTEDLEHDALLCFAKDLQHAPDLHVDRTQAKEHFSGWLARIIARDCSHALRTLRRGQTAAPMPRGYDAVDRQIDVDAQIDLMAAIEKLPLSWRDVVALYYAGQGVGEIAESLGISYWKASRALRKGLARLAKMM